MNVVVNGKPRTLAAAVTVADLVAELGLTNRNVVVERNGEPLERARFTESNVCDGDRLEIVRAVPGG
jgi:thiamine biosynthesis protein ThiS